MGILFHQCLESKQEGKDERERKIMRHSEQVTEKLLTKKKEKGTKNGEKGESEKTELYTKNLNPKFKSKQNQNY